MAEATDGLEVGLVVYNAGAANRTVEFLDDSFDDSLKQIKLACIGPVALGPITSPPRCASAAAAASCWSRSLACLAGSATCSRCTRR